MISAADFRGCKFVAVRPFSEIDFFSLVEDTSPIQAIRLAQLHGGNPVKCIFKQLEQLRCKSILVEQNYTDRDYKSEFSVLYAKRFNVPSARCVRLHFFSKSHQTIKKVKNAKQIDNLLSDSASYLGFCVVRPTEYNRIGRTVISAPAIKPDSAVAWHVTCQAWFAAHLFGRQLKVFGSPFIQQETQVGSCAHAALWVVGRYMHMLGYCDEFLPDEINDLAKARQPRGRYYPAESGLVPAQMLDALHGMGLAAIHYGYFEIKDHLQKKTKPTPSDGDVIGVPSDSNEATKIQFIKKVVCPYIESGYPVILCLEKHVVVAVGQTVEIDKSTTNAVYKIPSLLINDDSAGPYVEYPLKSDETSGLYDPEKVTDIIAVLPHSAKLKGEFAEAVAKVFIKLFSGEISSNYSNLLRKDTGRSIDFPSSYRLRTYLMKASEFQIDMRQSWEKNGLLSEAADKLLRLDFPQYIWVCEVFSLEKGINQSCVAKFLLDSTAAHSDRSIMAILTKKDIVVFDRQNPEALPDIQPLLVEWQISPRQLHKFGVKTCSE